MEIPAKAVDKKMKYKAFRLGRKSKTFADDLVLYVENPKRSTETFIGANWQVQQGCRIQKWYAKINYVSRHSIKDIKDAIPLQQH